MRHSLRNVRDPSPLGVSRAVMAGYARTVAEGLRILPGPGVAEAFERLGGRFVNVPSTFGIGGDRILVHSASEVEFEGQGFGRDNLVGLGEALCAMLVHRPSAVPAYGDDVRLAVPRITPEGPCEAVRSELIWFGVELVMPAADFMARYGAGWSEDRLAGTYGVRPREVQGRMKSLGLASRHPLPDAVRIPT